MKKTLRPSLLLRDAEDDEESKMLVKQNQLLAFEFLR